MARKVHFDPPAPLANPVLCHALSAVSDTSTCGAWDATRTVSPCAVSERWSRLWLVHGTLRARLALLPGISFRVSVFENKNSLSVKDRFTCQGLLSSVLSSEAPKLT